MSHPFLARVLLAVFCFLQSAATIALDLNRTHAAHPQWLGHARFHVVWQTAGVVLLCLFAIAVIWAPGPLEPERFYAAALLACLPMLAFFAALATRGLYGGTLSDPGGIPPLLLRIGRRTRHIDLNLVAECAGLVTILFLIVLYRH